MRIHFIKVQDQGETTWKFLWDYSLSATRQGEAAKGTSLIEVLIAIAILSIGFFPLFALLSDSRRISTKSVEEMQGISLSSSMIDGIRRCPSHDLLKYAGQVFEDHNFPRDLKFKLGIPPCPPNLERQSEWHLLNQPLLPQERFSNPWGRILEIHVIVQRSQNEKGKAVHSQKERIHEARGFLQLNAPE